MKKTFLILLSAILLLSAASCKKQEESVDVEPLDASVDFRLHNDSNYFYMSVGGYFNESALINEGSAKTSVHNLLMKNKDESKADSEYYMEEYEYSYTIVSVSNIYYDVYNVDEDFYTITSVSTYNPAYITDRGIKVGDTRAMVKAAYGNASKKENSDDGSVKWIYQKDDNILEFWFQGKTLSQIMISNLPDDIYEVTTDSGSGGNVITIDENGNVIGGNSGYEIIVDNNGSSSSGSASSAASSSSQAASSANTSSAQTSSAPSSSAASSDSSKTDTDSGTVITIDDDGDVNSVIVEGN